MDSQFVTTRPRTKLKAIHMGIWNLMDIDTISARLQRIAREPSYREHVFGIGGAKAEVSAGAGNLVD